MEKNIQLASFTSIKLDDLSYNFIPERSLLFIQTSKNFAPTSLEFLDFDDDNCEHLTRNNFLTFDDNNSLQLTLEKVINNPQHKKQVKKGCICKKTKCLKMYCQCFSQGKSCTQDCICLHCSNSIQNIQEVKQAKKALFDKNERLKKRSTGCNCQKSNCLKKYCECFNAGNSCGNDCKCNSCSNTQAYKSKGQNEFQ